MSSPLNESDLIKKIVSGDRQAFAVLYQQYVGELYRYVYLFVKCKEDSEEIVQEIFVKIWNRREKLDEVTSFKAYIYKSAKNLLLDEIRKNAVKAKALLILKSDSEASFDKTDDRIIYNEHYQIAEQAISSLPEKRRLIFLMRTREELSLDEIAAKLSISKSVVKKQLYAGISFVRKYMQENECLFIVACCSCLLKLIQRGPF
jgi:RNA polymerase sigma-70 factor (family 1)